MNNNNDFIRVRGARQHNLKNVDLDIPKNKFVVFTGVSGSGKSSLAFDTIYAEGQRRYVESLSSYARQFLGVMQKPDVDFIEGLSPAISIDQKTTSHNPRSTVGTVTEIYDYLRLLFARVGHPHCHICGREISSQSIDQIVGSIIKLITETANSSAQAKFLILSPVIKDKKGEFTNLFENLKSKGYKKARIDSQIHDLDDDMVLIKTNKHSVDVIIDRLSVSKKDLRDEIFKKNLKSRLNDSVEQAIKLCDGQAVVSQVLDSGFEIPDSPKKLVDHLFSEKFACPVDNISFPEIEPRTFSFNTPYGACPNCLGIGKILKVNPGLVFSEEISITEGAILPFATMFENDTWYSRLVKQMCAEEGIDIHVPLKSLTKEQKNIILNGTSGKEYRVEGSNRFGRFTSIYEKYTGVVAELERRHKESQSDYVRGEIEKFMTEIVCPGCGGARLKKESLSVTIDEKSIAEVTKMSIEQTGIWVKTLPEILSGKEMEIGKLILKEIDARLSFLNSVGLDYLSLERSAATLAGGEAQRIRLASQIGSGLTGVLYVLDEPTIGLHPRDNDRLIATLIKLRDLGNSVIVVEHDKETIEAADYIVDFGPGAGKHGGAVISQGTIDEIKRDPNSITGKYLSGKRRIEKVKLPPVQKFDDLYQKPAGDMLSIIGCSQFNLKNVNLDIPLGKLVVVTGVSGSGKSTLIVETLYHALAQRINPLHRDTPGAFKRIEGIDNINKIILVDQSPIGRTPRSNPATYTKVFDQIRKVFAATKDARVNGFKEGRFSFNVKGGRCEACEGQGQIKIEMQFMPDIWVTCEICKGKRYNSQTLEIEYKGKSIADVLSLTVSEAKEFFNSHESVYKRLETLEDVGLEYMELGQSATTLSGGEAQRVKLASELGKKATGRTMYILDEPTTGLHFADLEKLLKVLRILVSRGNTVVVIEHNLDVIKNADHLIDLGPEGGQKGGEIVAEGTPLEVAKSKVSHTATFLRDVLNK